MKQKANSKQRKNKWADHYTRKAQKEGLAARSVYKLEEIQKKYNLIQKNQKILDLGCMPGSWMVFAANLIGKQGRMIGVDLKPVTIDLPSNARTIVADILEADQQMMDAVGHGFDGVLSDMAPSTTGNKHADSAKSFILSEQALNIARQVLKPGGYFVCKIFQGEDFEAFRDLVKQAFNRIKIYKPQSTRKESREIYVVGIDKHMDKREITTS